MLISLLQEIINGFADILTMLISVFPKSPFNAISGIVLSNDMYSFIAWLIPFTQIIALLEAWGLAIGIYYCYMVVARWIKLL